MDLTKIAKEVFEIESKEIANLSSLLTDDYSEAVKFIYASKGKLIISGMGKSGIIAKKIAATLSSTGTPSIFLHPGEAYHGDLGIIEKKDIVLLISYSGETEEVLKIIPYLKFQGNIIIGMSGNPQSNLAKNSNYHLNISIRQEACPLQLAPMSSTTVTLVMGDAIAVALMKLRNFKNNDFAQLHPGGSLGRRLLTTVESIMIKDDLPISSRKDNVFDVLNEIAKARLGLTVVCDHKKIIGIITDGDLRKAIELNRDTFFDLRAQDILIKNPIITNKSIKLIDAQNIMNIKKINSLLISDSNNQLLGIATYKNIMD